MPLNGNYFGQKGLIPGQGYTRGAGVRVDRSHGRSPSAWASRRTRRGSPRTRAREAAAYGYLFAMTPLGQPTNFTNPDSAGLLDPRPDDDPLNINPVLEAQSVIRQQTVNRVFGSAYAELQIAERRSRIE